MDGDKSPRMGDRRSHIERRSGFDTRTPEERERSGERRMGPDRRKRGERRVEKPAQGLSVTSVLLAAAMLVLFDVRFEDGRHTLDPLQQWADYSNAKIGHWVGQAFPSKQ